MLQLLVGMRKQWRSATKSEKEQRTCSKDCGTGGRLVDEARRLCKLIRGRHSAGHCVTDKRPHRCGQLHNCE